MMSSVQSRVDALEAHDKEHKRDILRLKAENVELQTAVYDLKEENNRTTSKLREIEAKFTELENDMRLVFSFKDEIFTRLSYFDSSVTRFRDNHDRLSKLETVMNEFRQEMDDYSNLIRNRLDVMERLRNKCDNNDSEETGVKTVVNVQDGVRQKSQEQGMSVTHQLEKIEKQNQDIQNNIVRLEHIKAQVLESTIQVHLKPQRSLKTGELVKLDTCEWMGTNTGSFDMTSCCLQPQMEGDYVVSLSFVQENDGELMMWANSDMWPNEFYFGKTVSDNDVFSVVHVFHLKKGQNLWLETCLIRGNASISGCYLYCWPH